MQLSGGPAPSRSLGFSPAAPLPSGGVICFRTAKIDPEQWNRQSLRFSEKKRRPPGVRLQARNLYFMYYMVYIESSYILWLD
jgi:hypothetical protein